MADASRYLDMHAAMLQLIVKAPRTAHELRTLTGASKNTPYRWLKALESEGLVRRDRGACLGGAAGFTPDTWTWIA